MRRLKRPKITNKLTSYFFIVTLMTAGAYTLFLMEFFVSGFEGSARFHLLAEANLFAKAYKTDNTVSLPSSSTVQLSYDELPEISKEGINILENIKVELGDFTYVDSVDEGFDYPEYDFLVVIYRIKLHDGRALYAVSEYDFKMLEEDDAIDWWLDRQTLFLVSIGVGYLILAFAALWFYNYWVRKKTVALVDWAESRTLDNRHLQRDDFSFDEFNRLAICLDDALATNAALIEREKTFLSHASHELRTPIAIIRANMDIIERLTMPDAATNALARVTRANMNMQLLTETLLWLGRKTEADPIAVDVDLRQLLDGLIEEQKYLLQDSNVTVQCDYQNAPVMSLPVTPLMIVLSNLVRNAFQHTQNGSVSVVYQDNAVQINNLDSDIATDQQESGFGLGLELTKKVCKRLGWQLSVEYIAGGVNAELTLPTNKGLQ